MSFSVRKTLFGSPIRTCDEEHQRLTKVKALAVFSSDALSSVAYATEEILHILILAGAFALPHSMPIALCIVLLLAVVATSYYQTIFGYPTGGGGYIVASKNLGALPGLISGSALMLDYVLTVAVSISAGVFAIISAFPELSPYRVKLCLVMILFIAWANLRGVKESGTIFAIPTYAFILTIFAVIGIGLFRYATGALVPIAPVLTEPGPVQAMSLFLLLRAFSSGCTALTGIEALSNGVVAFKKPEPVNASKTLIAMVVILGVMFLGITFLAKEMHIVPSPSESVLSQIGRGILGTGAGYFALQGATALILILAANTAFADFPRLTSFLARDGFLPRQLGNLGDRLVFSNGIISLAVLASLLVIYFEGNTSHLIPLYAVGVFLCFTVSQIGMVVHWYREQTPGWRKRAIMNGFGASTTGIVLLVVLVTKFTHGAWFVVLLIPLMMWVFNEIKQHYISFGKQITLDITDDHDVLAVFPERQYKIVVPISGINRASARAMMFASTLSKDVTAAVVNLDPRSTEQIVQRWEQAKMPIPLKVLESPYRSVVNPILDFLEEVDDRDPDRGLAVVVLPELVPARWWQHLLHNQTALLLKTILLYRKDETGSSRIIIDVPYRLQE